MKRILIALIAAVAFSLPAAAAGIEQGTYDKLVSQISRPRAPAVSGRYVIFTASGKSRFVGIAFEHEDYRVTHPFKRLARKGADGKAETDAYGKSVDPLLFYIAEIPEATDTLRYRMVVDGLWTTDPLNPTNEYDYMNGMNVSVLPVERYETFATSVPDRGQVRFAYEGAPGESITVAGSFNDWDPFMYDMTETSPGKYELVLPLPPGTWYYAFFSGTSQLPDPTNHDRAYSKDGRVASVITVE